MRSSFLPAISMMTLRTQPGAILDRVFYRNEQVVIEKAGQPRAVLISVVEYEDIQRKKQQARDRFMQQTLQLREAFKDVDPQELEQEVTQALQEVRATAKTP